MRKVQSGESRVHIWTTVSSSLGSRALPCPNFIRIKVANSDIALPSDLGIRDQSCWRAIAQRRGKDNSIPVVPSPF